MHADNLLKKAGIKYQVFFERGEPEKVISDHVEQYNIDLLVMGAYGHSRIRNLMIGSTTTQMIRSCLVPVLLFRLERQSDWNSERQAHIVLRHHLAAGIGGRDIGQLGLFHALLERIVIEPVGQVGQPP